MSGDPFATASAYRAKGWTGTLPLPLGRKTPPPAGFTGDGGAWPSPADLADWAEQAPQNIALRLPPNVIALDVDDAAAFLALVELVGPLPATWRAHSGGDRLGHLYYRLPAGVVSTGWGVPCPGVDLLRHGHRYSIVAPSVHPSGTTYGWARPNGVDSASILPGLGDLPELPAAWVTYLAGDSAPDNNESSPAADRPPRDDFGTVGDAIPSGRHQEWLFLYACSLRARGVPEEEAAALVRLRAARDCVPPWSGPDDPWEAVAHAYTKYEAGTPADAPWPAYDAAVEALAHNPEQASRVVSDPARFTFLDWRELASTPPEPVDWLIPGILAAGRGHVLYSETGIGKSLVTLEWCVAMVRAGRTVLYVDHENDPRGDVWDRLFKMRVDPDELDGLRYLSYPEMSPLDTPAGGAELLAVALEVGPDIAVVDTATRTVKGEENSNDTWTAWDRNTGVKLRKAGIGFLRIDHSGKNAERGQRGGSNKATDVDLVWRLERTDEDEFLLTNEKARIAIPEKSIGLRRERIPNLHHVRTRPPTQLEKEAKIQRDIWAAMDALGVDIPAYTDAGQPVGVNALAKLMRAAGMSGTDKFLASVAKVRWAHLHNDHPPARPDWAPPMSDSTDSEGAA